MTFDPRLICSALDAEEVRFVLIDLTFSPAGSLDGFDGWDERAVDTEIAPTLVVRIAALDDIIDSKRAAGRAKDEHALPYLESLRDEIQRRGRDPRA